MLNAAVAKTMTNETSFSFHSNKTNCVLSVNYSNGTNANMITNCTVQFSSDLTTKIVQVSLLVVIFIASLVGNGIVFCIFIKKPSLRTISNKLVLNLAVSNVAITAILLPVTLASFLSNRWLLGYELCQFTGMLTITLLTSCTFTLVAISIDRYLAIVKPFLYTSKMNHKRTWWIISFIWIFSLILSMPPLFGMNEYMYHTESGMCAPCWRCENKLYQSYTFLAVIVCSLLPFSIMLWAYCTIFKQAHKCSARARSNSLSQLSVESQSIQLTGSTDRLQQNNGQQRRRSSTVSLVMATLNMRNGIASARVNAFFQKEEWRTAKTGLMIMSTFTLCWVPMFIIITLEGFHLQSRLPDWIHFACVSVAFLGCALNPIVYVFRNRVIKHYMKYVLCGQKPVANGVNGSKFENSRQIVDAPLMGVCNESVAQATSSPS